MVKYFTLSPLPLETLLPLPLPLHTLGPYPQGFVNPWHSLRPELDGNLWNVLETTVLYKTRARLTSTLTHVVTYALVTSGAEARAMSSLSV